MLTEMPSRADSHPALNTAAFERSAPPRPVSASIAETIILGMLFAASCFGALRKPNVSDNDIWWHLRTGDLILASHAVPAVDTFSRPVAGHPWHAYSWLFDLLISVLFSHLGLRGIIIYTASVMLAIAIAVYVLIQLQQKDFSLSAVLTLGVMFSLSHIATPRPWLLTALFFLIELNILMRARLAGRTRILLWLPPLFALWANIHIQFIDGLVVLAVAVLESFVTRTHNEYRHRIPLPWTVAIFAASTLATLVNPYGWLLYRDAYNLSSQSGVLSKINELQAIPFRDAADFAILFLTIASVAVLARRRSLAIFETVLLLFALAVTFRSQRDVWVMAGAASVILGTLETHSRQENQPLPFIAMAGSFVISLLILVPCGRLFHINEPHLSALTRKELPVAAAEFVQRNRLQGRLYNDFGWGGYLLWKLKTPVSIDGRAALYGDQLIDRSVATWTAQPNWSSDQLLTSSGVVIGPVSAPLVQLLRADPRYRLAYEDPLAAVFVARKPSQSPR